MPELPEGTLAVSTNIDRSGEFRSEIEVVRRLEKGAVITTGPLRLLAAVEDGHGVFVRLEDANDGSFMYPKWLEVSQDDTKHYKTTVDEIWTGYCLCEKSDKLDDVPAGFL
ncbi:hypothetical protein R1sor_016949 [Riccia sorocarpa]|uniref:Uncharacterized protein n=1 Tax=Riccia sorocarpa TaxID=122646 RepID=A0ABD3I5B7_9MARC